MAGVARESDPRPGGVIRIVLLVKSRHVEFFAIHADQIDPDETPGPLHFGHPLVVFPGSARSAR